MYTYLLIRPIRSQRFRPTWYKFSAEDWSNKQLKTSVEKTKRNEKFGYPLCSPRPHPGREHRPGTRLRHWYPTWVPWVCGRSHRRRWRRGRLWRRGILRRCGILRRRGRCRTVRLESEFRPGISIKVPLQSTENSETSTPEAESSQASKNSETS